MLTIEKVKTNGWLIFEAITGSRAYNLAMENSDIDIRGVYILPKEIYYSLDYYPQVANETNDIVYYELKRFFELLAKSNPNILELLNVPAECVLMKHPLMEQIDRNLFLAKQCEDSFAQYAYTQIRKAYGLEKKIMNPVAKERKSLLEFCYVYRGKSATLLTGFLKESGYNQEELGLSAIDHLKDCYNLFHSKENAYLGIVRKEESNDVCLSSIPKGEVPVGMLYFNKDGYSSYCKSYREYWDWVEKRNEQRYQTTLSHGKNYDSKNMMHVFRLLNMAKEIALEGKINVWRRDRDFLLDIRNGKFEYEELLVRADQLRSEIHELFSRAQLPDRLNLERINQLLVDMRLVYYR